MILERNPFDPDRGQVEAEPEEPVEVVPVGMPILEGTLLFGDTQFAIFSGKEEGKRVSFRVPLEGDFNGYTLVHIDRNFVQLRSNSETIKLELYSGAKEDRGGSKAGSSRGEGVSNVKTITTRPPSAEKDRRNAVTRSPIPARTPRTPAKDDDDKNASRFVRRDAPKPKPTQNKTNMKNKI